MLRLAIMNTLQTISEDINPAGAISTRQHHTPKAQYVLISLDDLRLIIRTIRGIFHNGSTTDAINAIL